MKVGNTVKVKEDTGVFSGMVGSVVAMDDNPYRQFAVSFHQGNMHFGFNADELEVIWEKGLGAQ